MNTRVHQSATPRQREGIAAAKARGVYTGRAPALTPEQADQLRARAAAGEGKATLATEISRSYNDLIGVEMSQTELSARFREIVILTVGVEWQADYETYAHAAVARAVGLSGTVIAAVLNSHTPSDVTAQEAAAHAFSRQLVPNRRVDDATYARAESLFGASGLVDLVHLIGFYLTTCALLNAFNVPAPTVAQRP